MNRCVLTVCVLLGHAAWVARGTADEVILRGSTSASRITLTGEVLDYTGKRLTLRTAPTKPEQSYSAADVIAVKTSYNEAHQAGLRALDQGQTELAAPAFERALEQELRTWVRRDLLVLQVRCDLRREDWVSAAQRFLRLYQSDPDTKSIDLMPVRWTTQAITLEMRGQAAVWLKESSPISSLIAASWLCFEPKYETECEHLWPSLVRLPDERLRSLAQWQSYRRRQHFEGVDEPEIRRWEARISRLPHELRAGPYFMLGQAFGTLHQHDLAAATYLRVPFSHSTDHPLTSRALFEAAVCFERMRLNSEATALFREVVDQHGHTQAAHEARLKLGK